MYTMDESEEDEEEVEGKMIGGGGDEVSVMSVVYPVGRLVSHHWVLFCLLFIIQTFSSFPSYLSRSTPYSRVFKEEEGEEVKTHQSTGREGQA